MKADEDPRLLESVPGRCRNAQGNLFDTGQTPAVALERNGHVEDLLGGDVARAVLDRDEVLNVNLALAIGLSALDDHLQREFQIHALFVVLAGRLESRQPSGEADLGQVTPTARL